MIKLFFMSLFFVLPSNDYSWVVENVKTSYQLEFVMLDYSYRDDVSDDEEDENLTIALERQAFDCEEGAELAYRVLTNHGYDCIIYVVDKNSEDAAHAFTYFKKEKDEGYFSNTTRYIDREFTISKYCAENNYDNWRVDTCTMQAGMTISLD